MINVQSPQAKRILAKHLEGTPFMEMILACSSVFGPLGMVGYRGKGENACKRELQAYRKGLASESLKKAREKLNEQ